MVNIKIVLHRIIFCSTYRQNTHSQRRPKQPTMMSGSGSSWAWSRMGLLSSRELGLLPLMIAPCYVLRDVTRREATTFRVVGYGVFFLLNQKKNKTKSSIELYSPRSLHKRMNVFVYSNPGINEWYNHVDPRFISY